MNDRESGEIPPGTHNGVQPYRQALVPSTYVNYQGPEEETHLRDYLAVIMKRKWIVVSFLLSVIVITMVLTFMTTPHYKSTVVIRIGQDNGSDPLKNLQTVQDPDYYQTQYEILKSDALAEKVIRKLDLANNRDFRTVDNALFQTIGEAVDFPRKGIAALSSWIDPGDHAKIVHRPSGETPIYLIDLFLSRLEIDPVKNSQLVQVNFSSASPELSVKVAKAIADAYIDYNLESRVDSSREAKEFLRSQIELTKTKLEDAEKKLNDFASKNGIIYLDSDKKSVLVQKLSEITTALSTMTTERMQKEALYREIKESGDDNPVILDNSLIQQLKKDYATLESEYSNKLRTFTPDYPSMKNLKSQMDAIRDRISKEKAAIEASIASDYKTALKKEAYLKGAFDSQQRKVLDFQDKAAEYQTLKREADVTKELHNSLLQKFNEVGIAAMSQATNIQILDYPRYPTMPATPQKLLNFLLSIAFGLMGGVGLAFLIEYFDNTVKDTHDIEKRTMLPSLGMVPFHSALGEQKRPELAYSNLTKSVSEAFRSIGTFILLSSTTKPPKTILVTSPGEKEGKTTVCINVALALSESLGNGILIDADMRKPKLHHAFNLENRTGLSSYLSGTVDFTAMNGSLIRQTAEKGLRVITAGPVPSNPSRLLHSSRMRELLDNLYETYSFIIIDAAPIIGIPDSVLLSKMVDGTILVVRAGETPTNALSSTTQIFRDVNTNLLGVVLNAVRKNDLKYGYYSSYFSSYFADGETK